MRLVGNYLILVLSLIVHPLVSLGHMSFQMTCKDGEYFRDQALPRELSGGHKIMKIPSLVDESVFVGLRRYLRGAMKVSSS